VKDWTAEERARMRADVPTTALKTPFRNITIRDIALEALRISHQGLRRRQINDAVGRDETQYLAPLFQIAEADFTPAEDLLCAYARRWDHSVDPAFREYAY
jgi:glutamate--cysteine ligase